jgi:hypothetical protein
MALFSVFFAVRSAAKKREKHMAWPSLRDITSGFDEKSRLRKASFQVRAVDKRAQQDIDNTLTVSCSFNVILPARHADRHRSRSCQQASSEVTKRRNGPNT